MDVSIIIPCVKDRGYLDEAIQSALNQDFQGEYEIILASDGNPELKKVADKYGIKFSLLKEKGNLSKNQNKAMEIARGKYIKGLADDDLLTPRSLTYLFNYLSTHSMYAMIYANACRLENNKISPYVYKSRKEPTILNLKKGNFINGGTTMYHADTLRKIGGRDESIDCAEDIELYVSFLKMGYKIGRVNKYVYKYRIHPDQKSKKNAKNMNHYRSVKKYIFSNHERHTFNSNNW